MTLGRRLAMIAALLLAWGLVVVAGVAIDL